MNEMKIKWWWINFDFLLKIINLSCSVLGKADRGDGDVMSSQDHLALRSGGS